jgi:ribosomal protein S12 methylthiotransferase
MDLQAGISRAHNSARIGGTFEVLVEGPDEGAAGLWTGRARFQAPEVDGIVRFRLPPGLVEPPAALVRVVVEGADAYDLSGRLVP